MSEPLFISLLVYLSAGAVAGWIHSAVCERCTSQITDRSGYFAFMALSAVFAIPVIVFSMIISIWHPCEGERKNDGMDQ